MLHCVFRASAEESPAGVASLPWLSGAERELAGALRFEPRRRDWLRGRRAAKEAIARVLRERWGAAPPLADIAVEPGPGGAPGARLAREAAAAGGFAPGQRLPVAVSISHRAGAVFCVAAAADEVAGLLGADLELLEPRSAAFLSDFLSDEERAACAAPGRAAQSMASVVWGAKEAVLKALRLGLTVDTRSLVCLPGDAPAPEAGLLADGEVWRTCRLLKSPPGAGSVAMACLWRTRGPFVQTLALGRPALRARGAA